MPILINASESGNCTSFEALYERYHAAIARRVKCFLVRDPEMVEDVCQEVWIAVWKALPHTPEPSYTWLYRIATNVSINALRKKYHYWPHRRGTPIPLPLSLDAHYDEECDLPLGEMLEDPNCSDPAESCLVDIEQALARLTSKERRLLVLRAQGYKFDEIEQIVGTGRRMTWLHVDRARAAFRHAYALGESEEVA